MNIISDKFKALDYKGRSFPLLKGDVKITLKNVHNGKKEVIEGHNAPTNALADIFSGNFGGLLNYDSFSDLYETYLGGVLIFASALDPSVPANYGIPAEASNSLTAHSGRIPLTDQADDIKRGNPDNTGTVKTGSSTKLVWEWGTSAGNGTIASLGLTHSEVGSYGCGIKSEAQKLLNPFADVATVSRTYAYDNNGSCCLAINGNIAYNVYLASGLTVNIYKTPINNTKFKLQGGALLPITDYSTKVTATLPYSYGTNLQGYYYWFDFANNKLVLFGVATEGGALLYRDDIDLDDGTVTHSDITVTGAKLWKFTTGNQNIQYSRYPTKAIIYNNHLYIYGYSSVSTTPDRMYIVNLAETTDISEVDKTDFPDYSFAYRVDSFDGLHRINERFTAFGGIIAHRSFIINSDKLYPVSDAIKRQVFADYLTDSNSIISPTISPSGNVNALSICKLYLATKYNLDSPVTKTSAQSLTVEYTLTEV